MQQEDHENDAHNQFPHYPMKNIQQQLIDINENGKEALQSIHKIGDGGNKDDTLLRR